MKQCADSQTLMDFLNDDLPEVRTAELAEHVAHCALCDAALARLVESHSDFPHRSSMTFLQQDASPDEWSEGVAAHLAVRLAHANLPRPPLADLPGSTESFPSDEEARIHVVHRTQELPNITELVVHDLIGRGGMGDVYRATQCDLNREVAVKVLASTKDRERESLRIRFEREAQITARLDHPSVVPVYSVGECSDSRCYYSMRLVRGRELKAVFELAQSSKDGWTIARVIGVLIRVCQTVAFAHARNVIHRDLKPSNIMVGELGEVYVMDWGLARALDSKDTRDIRLKLDPGSKASVGEKAIDHLDLQEIRDSHAETTENRGSEADDNECLRTMDGAVVGTPAYMSPEQARGDVQQVDQLSDIYSLGAMLYQLLSGRIPHVSDEQDSPLVILRSVIESSPTSLGVLAPGAAPELVAICDKAMAREREARYSTASQLADDLQAFLDQRVVSAYRTGALAEGRKWFARNRAVAISSLLAISALVGGLAALTMQQASANKQLNAANSAVSESLSREQQAARSLADTNRDLIASEQAERTARIREESAAKEAREAREAERAAKQTALDQLAESYANFGEQESQNGNHARAALWYLAAADSAQNADAQHIHRMRANQHSRQAPFTEFAWWDRAALKKKEYLDWPMVTDFGFSPCEQFLRWRSSRFGQTLILEPRNEARQVWADQAFVWAAFSPDRAHVAVSTGKTVQLRRLSDESIVCESRLSDGSEIRRLEFSHDGRLLLVMGNKSQILDTKNKQFIAGNYATPQNVIRVGFDVDGKRLLVVTHDQQQHVFDVDDQTGEHAARRINFDENQIEQEFAFPNEFGSFPTTADGKGLDDVYPAGSLADGFRACHGADRDESERVLARADGCGIVRLISIRPDRPWRYIRTDGWATPLISDDGRRVLPVGHTHYSPGKQELFETRVFDIATGVPLGEVISTGHPIMAGQFSADGNTVVIAFSALERTPASMIASNGEAGFVQFFDAKTGAPAADRILMPAEPQSLAWHHEKNLVAVACHAGHVLEVKPDDNRSRLIAKLNATTNPPIRHLPGDFCAGGISLALDGKSVFHFGNLAPCQRVDLSTGKVLNQYGAGRFSSSDAFELSGRVILSRTVQRPRLHDVRTGEALQSVQGGGSVARVDRSGRYIVASGGVEAVVWDTREQRRACHPRITHNHRSVSDFIHGTRFLVSASVRSKTWLQCWDWQSGRAVTPRLDIPGGELVSHLRTTSDGQFALMRCVPYGLLIVDLRSFHGDPLENLSPEDARLLAEINAIAQIVDGRISTLKGEEWTQKWDEFRSRHPSLHARRAAAARQPEGDYHASRAFEFEVLKNAAAAQFHRAAAKRSKGGNNK